MFEEITRQLGEEEVRIRRELAGGSAGRRGALVGQLERVVQTRALVEETLAHGAGPEGMARALMGGERRKEVRA